MDYTRVIYNNDYGFIIRYKINNAGFIYNNKITIYYAFESGIFDRINRFVDTYDDNIVLHEKHLINEILDYSGSKGFEIYLYSKVEGVAQKIKVFFTKHNKKYEKKVIRFGTNPSKYIPKKLS